MSKFQQILPVAPIIPSRLLINLCTVVLMFSCKLSKGGRKLTIASYPDIQDSEVFYVHLSQTPGRYIRHWFRRSPLNDHVYIATELPCLVPDTGILKQSSIGILTLPSKLNLSDERRTSKAALLTSYKFHNGSYLLCTHGAFEGPRKFTLHMFCHTVIPLTCP